MPASSAVEPHDDEGIEQVEANGRNNKQVHGGNVRRMVTQGGSPSLAKWLPSLDHVRCQRKSISGRMIVKACKIDGNQRYSWIKNQRSWLVSRTGPCSLRLKTIT